MSRKTTETAADRNRDAEMDVDTSLSGESKRQRDGTGNIGAFGKRVGHSDLIFLEGILPTIDSTIVSDRSIERQTEIAFDNLEAALDDRRNATLADVMKLEVQLTDPSTAESVDDVYESRFAGIDLRPRTVVGVCSLPGGAAIQLDVVAADE